MSNNLKAQYGSTPIMAATTTTTTKRGLAPNNQSQLPIRAGGGIATTTQLQLQQHQQQHQHQQPETEKQPRQQQSSNDDELNEICAVAITGGEPKDSASATLRCVVSRNNKSMDVYEYTHSHTVDQKSSKLTQSPCLSYRTPKRVSCFVFATLPAGESRSSKSERKTVLISGDVAGDSYAFNLESKGQKLLLGHTASMLTDIAIVHANPNPNASANANANASGTDKEQQALLLTSDRDEKIRISRFPESTVVEGFLLGHTAYITGLALIAPSKSSNLSSSSSLSSVPMVVSCGGDRTIRLWNLCTHTQVGCLSTVSTEIPTAIVASSCGTRVAVIFDDSKRVSLYQIHILNNGIGDSIGDSIGDTAVDAGADTSSLELLGSIDCPSQPLAVEFSDRQTKNETTVLTILTKDPDYLVRYDVPCDGTKATTTTTAAVAIPRDASGAIRALQVVAASERIVMPSTILEKDDFGNPVLQKENETRGPAASDQPWNRVERVEIAKERGKRRKKKAKLTAAAEAS
mmetsp:Transcript_3012/g.8250  ORF Transcript_3012/g.8250 Transcript_3012/m.8250 type:complete len:519 (-) Transcript_3012:68-1624(-)